MNVGPNPNPVFDEIMANAPLSEGANAVPDTFINAKDLLPRSRSYYQYSGSLTTPPCTEGVRWQVLKQPVQVSQSAVDKIHEIIGLFPGYAGFDNNRPVRPLNDRPIFESIGR
jgi:carbonic anhydrase